MSESIHVGGKLVGEGAALAAIKDHRSILYLAPDERDDCAYDAPGAATEPELPTHGFAGLAALGRAGGVEVVRCPLPTDLLKTDDAEVVDGILLGLSRPTLVMSTTGRRACAAKAIYLGRKGDLTELTQELIKAAASDQYLPPNMLTMIPDEVHESSQSQWRLEEWHEVPKLKKWVEGALKAKAGPGTEEVRVGSEGWMKGVGGGGEGMRRV